MSASYQFGRTDRPWLGKNRTKGELYPVPLEMVERAWRDAKYAIQAPKSGIGRAYDIERLHGRLLLGTDRLWMAAFTEAYASCLDQVAGIVITSLGRPPQDLAYKLFDRRDKNSLTVHFIAGRSVWAWIGDAVEKIARYGEENGCKQLFALARLPWMKYLYSLHSRFERVGLARDRMTRLGRNIKNPQQRPGHFRLLCKDLPPRATYECARHQGTRMYIPPKGEPNGSRRQSHNYSADASALTADAL